MDDIESLVKKISEIPCVIDDDENVRPFNHGAYRIHPDFLRQILRRIPDSEIVDFWEAAK